MGPAEAGCTEQGTWLDGGSGGLEYLGRLNQQIKIRGFRVETWRDRSGPGAPSRRSSRRGACSEDRPGDKRLVAYAGASRGPSAPRLSALRSHLSTALPTTLVPNAILTLPALPLTPNGKLGSQSAFAAGTRSL